MTMTAAVTLSSATATAGGVPVIVTITVSNSSTTIIPVLSIKPLAYATGTTTPFPSVQLDIPDINPTNTAVAGSGSTAYRFSVEFDGPQIAGAAGKSASPATLGVDITGEVRCGDGTIIWPTVATVTVSPPPHS
jgi:hypothetical protein